MRLRLVEGTPPEAEYSNLLPTFRVFGEREDGSVIFADCERSEWSLENGRANKDYVRPLPPGTIITITVRDAAPHSVCVDRPGPVVEWLTWGQVKSGEVVVAKDGKAYIKSAVRSGYRLDVNLEFLETDMIGHQYRRPFAPWSLVPVEEPTP